MMDMYKPFQRDLDAANIDGNALILAARVCFVEISMKQGLTLTPQTTKVTQRWSWLLKILL
jgi:hypothetical protein